MSTVNAKYNTQGATKEDSKRRVEKVGKECENMEWRN